MAIDPGCECGNADIDRDGFCSDVDNCPDHANADQEDADGDGFGDACDRCPDDPNKVEPGQCGCGNADTDSDGGGLADCLDPCPNDPENDIDDDGVCGDVDNCPETYNPGQLDNDGDGIGNICELPPKLSKKEAYRTLASLIPTGDKKSDKRVEKALKHIAKCLDEKYWVG